MSSLMCGLRYTWTMSVALKDEQMIKVVWKEITASKLIYEEERSTMRINYGIMDLKGLEDQKQSHRGI